MSEYNIRHTDTTVPRITIPESEINNDSVDLELFGRIAPEYGENLNEDLLNLLENFACPEDPSTADFKSANPDLTQVSKKQLHNPTIGQLWYNTTRKTVYFWRGEDWYPIPLREFVAANWGTIMDGEQLPKPVSPITGQVFDYKDCIWSVAPSNISGGTISAYVCGTDDEATVTMYYKLASTNYTIPGMANYLIIGIRGNYNVGERLTPMVMMPTPTPTPTPIE